MNKKLLEVLERPLEVLLKLFVSLFFLIIAIIATKDTFWSNNDIQVGILFLMFVWFTLSLNIKVKARE